tara:strand:- start:124 stop:846 length:723 start_codon:yes stop_codon:yes gene_type:complete
MTWKTTFNYSPNFNDKKRSKKSIKFLIFHYTGMKSEKKAIQRLTNIQSQVASHYLVKFNGDIVIFVPDLYVAWHAGLSAWKKYSFLNKNSIGIEISNPGHEFGYKNFSKKQINSLIKLSSFLIKKYKISKKNILGHSDISPLRKKDPGEKFPWEYLAKKKIGYWYKINKNRLADLRNKKCSKILKNQFFNHLFQIGYSKIYKHQNEKLIVKAFQRRFRPKLINGIIDRECLLISKKLAYN